MKDLRKNALRMQLLSLLNKDELWYKKDDDDFQSEIQYLAKKLCEPVRGENLDWQNMTPSKFKYLLDKDFTLEDISNMYNVSMHAILTWRNAHKIDCKKGKTI